MWRLKPQTPDRWTVGYDHAGMHLRMRMGLTSFKHVGIFPEQAANWNFIYDRCRALAGKGGRPRLLNLFAYGRGDAGRTRRRCRDDARRFGAAGGDVGA